MQITVFRPLRDDAGYLESTWHHVTQEEGVRLQLQEEFFGFQDRYRARWNHDFTMRLAEQRRVVKGSFHPGRRVLPNSAITYELVYECSTPESALVDEDTMWERAQSIFRDYVRGTLKRGNETTKEE